MLDDVEYIICKTQGRIYRYIAAHGYDVEAFSDAYLRSDFCRRAMDTIYSRFQWADEEECLDFITQEIDLPKMDTTSVFDPDVAFWIGFTYRQLYIETNRSSRQLCKDIPFGRMCAMYPGMHTIAEDSVAEIIAEGHGWKLRDEEEKQEY